MDFAEDPKKGDNTVRIGEGAHLTTNESLETLATVLNKTQEHIVAMCKGGIFYYLKWTGKEPAYKGIKIGELVRVYYTPGFNPTVHTIEILDSDSGGV